MKKIILIIFIGFGILSHAQAQDYNTGIGLRGGLYNGITIKHFVGTKAAFEGIIEGRWKGYGVTVLYEIHGQAFNTARLNWYYGFGGHIGFWNGNHTKWGDRDRDYTVIGADGILGLEYNFKEAPINISIDWKPTLNLIGYEGFWSDSGALSIRYIF